MSTDPTKYPFGNKIEQTQAARSYMDIPIHTPTPPPPPKRSKTWLVILAWSLSLVGSGALGYFFGSTTTMPARIVENNPKPIVTITPIVTPTTPPHLTAYQIVNKLRHVTFLQNVTDTSNVGGSTGMSEFEVSDISGGSAIVTLGTYETSEEARRAVNYYVEGVGDGSILGYSYNYCMMWYGPGMTAYDLTPLIQQANSLCI